MTAPMDHLIPRKKAAPLWIAKISNHYWSKTCGYFVGCENESTYRVWDPESKTVRRATYAMVDDGEGIDDPHEYTPKHPENFDRNAAMMAEHVEDEDDEDDEDEDDEPSPRNDTRKRTGTTSKYFNQNADEDDEPSAPSNITGRSRRRTNRPAQIDTARRPPSRQSVQSSSTEPHSGLQSSELPRGWGVPQRHLNRAPAQPRSGTQITLPADFDIFVPETMTGVFDQFRYKENSDGDWTQQGPINRFQGKDTTSSTRQIRRKSQRSPDGRRETQSPLRPNNNTDIFGQDEEGANGPETEDNNGFEDSEDRAEYDDPDPMEGQESTTGGIIQEYEDDEPAPREAQFDAQESLLSRPQTTRKRPLETSESDSDSGKLKCPFCKKPMMKTSLTAHKKRCALRPPDDDATETCTYCNELFSKSAIITHEPRCPRRPSIVKRNGLPVCPKCDQTKHPAGFARHMKTCKGKKNQNVDDSDEDDEAILQPKRDETKRGTKVKAKAEALSDEDSCQFCFHYGKFCNQRPEGERCANCAKYKRVCKPLERNSDGSLPPRKYAKTPINFGYKGVSMNDRCYRCANKNMPCDVELPLDSNHPCTNCAEKGKALCVTQERGKRIKEGMPKCLACKRWNRRCDREHPCHSCYATNSRCTYETEDSERWISKIPNPVDKFEARMEMMPKNDPKIDMFLPDDFRCTWCQHNRMDCDAIEGGPPCHKCLISGDHTANRCVRWWRPGELESVATRLFRLAEDGSGTERIPGKTNRDLRRENQYARDEDPDDDVNAPYEIELSDSDAEVTMDPREAREKAKQRLQNFQALMAVSLATIGNPSQVGLLPDPQTFTEAMRSPDADEWRKAVSAEYNSLLENDTFEVVPLPPGRKALTTKWVLRKKLGPMNEILKHKARMVARGFQQVEGYDYTETYSGVVKASAYRLLFALMVKQRWTCHQLDVVTAFLNGDMYEEVYITPPQGYPQPGKVLKLKKALYGLKQSPRMWYRKLRQWLLENNWSISKYDECVFFHSRKQLIITVYVDDINVFGPSEEYIKPFKDDIARAFKVTDAGRASWYLGMQIDWRSNGLHIHQSGFAQQALSKYGMIGANPATIPLDPSKKLTKETDTVAETKYKTHYMSMVGSLNYLQSKTRWDLAFPVSLVSRFMTNPTPAHMEAVLQEFRYVAGTPDQGLFFHHDGDGTLRGFVDSDWGGCTDTGRSTTGWVFTLAGCPISWASQRQKTVSSSTTEAEYIAASDACKEAIWLKGFHNELSQIMRHDPQETVELAVDNASALKLTKNPEFHGRTKHINIRHHYIRELVERGDIKPIWISGKENPADLFTKALARPLFQQHCGKLGHGKPVSNTLAAEPRVIEDSS